jgi:hypothetical protein
MPRCEGRHMRPFGRGSGRGVWTLARRNISDTTVSFTSKPQGHDEVDTAQQASGDDVGSSTLALRGKQLDAAKLKSSGHAMRRSDPASTCTRMTRQVEHSTRAWFGVRGPVLPQIPSAGAHPVMEVPAGGGAEERKAETARRTSRWSSRTGVGAIVAGSLRAIAGTSPHYRNHVG